VALSTVSTELRRIIQVSFTLDRLDKTKLKFCNHVGADRSGFNVQKRQMESVESSDENSGGQRSDESESFVCSEISIDFNQSIDELVCSNRRTESGESAHVLSNSPISY